MGKFNNPRAFAVAEEPRSPALPMVSTPAPAAGPVVLPAVIVEQEMSSVQRLGFLLLCTYLLSGFANDLALRFLHAKTYLSLLAEVLLPIVLLFSGAAFRAFRVSAGRMWFFFFLWLLVDLPFSVWRGGTVMLLMDYGLKNWPFLFYVASFAVTLTMLRRLMYVQAISSVLLLLSCYAFGQQSDDGRLTVRGSLFFENSNELAMDILMGVAALLFIVIRGNRVPRLLALGAIAGSIVYALRTASRGGLLGLVALFICVTLISRYKLAILAFTGLIALVSSLLVPAQTLDRLRLVFSTQPSPDASITGNEMSALASRAQRQELLRRSLIVAATHPLFGVGPGQFAVSENGEAAKEGKWSAWLGTHNSYTQVAAECGLPAFICYMGVIIFSFRSNFRLLRATRNNPAHADLYALSFCMLASMTVYAVCTFFDHIAYSGLLATLGGFSISLRLLAEHDRILTS